MANVETEMKRARPLDEQADYVMSFVETAEEYMQPFEETWEEVEASWLVRPPEQQSLAPLTKYPFIFKSSEGRQNNGRAILKDPETHQAVMSIISGIVQSISPEDGFINAKHKGFEDIYKGKTVNGLLEYQAKLEGEFSAMFEWLLGAGIYGTGISEIFWDYVEEPRSLRSVEFDPYSGAEFSTSTIMNVPVWDDPRSEAFDIRDFFPDTGQCKLGRMKGAARRQKITAQRALYLADLGVYKKKAVLEAIERRQGSSEYRDSRKTDDETGLNYPLESHDDFMDMPKYRYCGEVPFKVEGDEYMRREIVVLNGVTVRSEVWARRLPWFDCKITPRLGSFYGISPAEIMRYDQDFADTLKMMLADAVVRMVHPPHIYDRNQNVDLAKLRRFSPNTPIGADSIGAIQQVPYNPPVQPAFQMYSGIKQQMRQGSSATEANQGLGLGSKRLSASEAVGTFERSGIRPEMFNRVMEQEYLPPRGKYTLELYQEHLEDTEDLAYRIGESETTVALADILADFDVTFIGSRKAGTIEQELQAFREIISAGANPSFFALIPWIPLLRKHFEKLGAPEIAAMVGNPQMTQLNMMLTQLAGPDGLQSQGNGNGEQPSQSPIGSLPAQTFGGVA